MQCIAINPLCVNFNFQYAHTSRSRRNRTVFTQVTCVLLIDSDTQYNLSNASRPSRDMMSTLKQINYFTNFLPLIIYFNLNVFVFVS